MLRPADPYDPSWLEYWADHPGEARSVGAAAVDPAPADPAPVPAAAVDPAPADPKPADPAEAADWRAGIADEKLRDHAGRFASLDDVIRANLDSRQKLSKAIIPPGKDASEDDVKGYLKAIGVPAEASGYEFPEIPKEQMTDAIQAERDMWAKEFHDARLPDETAKRLVAKFGEVAQAHAQAQAKADKDFAQSSSEALKAEWGADNDKNMTLANRAFDDMTQRAGIASADMRKIETKDGRFVMDDPRMLKMFAALGREMGEGSLGGTMTEGDRETIDEQIRDLRKQTDEAKSGGDSKRANQLYQKTLGMIEKRDGAQAIVGSQNRAA